jgi:hypothetical protein
MSTSEPKAGERVLDVRVTEDTISVDLYDGRTIITPLLGFLVSCMQRLSSGPTGASRELATAFTGQISTGFKEYSQTFLFWHLSDKSTKSFF